MHGCSRPTPREVLLAELTCRPEIDDPESLADDLLWALERAGGGIICFHSAWWTWLREEQLLGRRIWQPSIDHSTF